MSPRGRSGYGLFVVMLLVSAVCVSLGVWQGRRLAARRSANQVALAARALPEIDLTSDVPNQAPVQRRIRATGVFDHERSFVLRGRVEREVPGVQIVVPLRLRGREDAVLVNRGFVPAADAARPDTSQIDRPDSAEVSGLAFAIPAGADSGAPLAFQGATTWRRLDREAIRARLPYPVLDVYLHQVEPDARPEGATRWPRPAALPPLDNGPHFSYMVQWFGIAAVALVFGVIALRRDGEKREREREPEPKQNRH
jgi:surfeit locus 1 family protein